jgi:hypothetical protein
LIILGWNALVGEWAPTLGASGAIYSIAHRVQPALARPHDHAAVPIHPHARDLVHSFLFAISSRWAVRGT